MWLKLSIAAVVLALGGIAAAIFLFSGSDSKPPVVTTTLPTAVPTPVTLKGVAFQVAAASQKRFAWPAEGPVSRYFGTAGSTGIDIVLDPVGETPVLAAASGRVIFAGGNACCEYGHTVIIDHGNGYSTLYGHLSEYLVGFGQQVQQGDWVGTGGSTGNAPVKQVHFELRNGSQYLDPLRYLSYDQQQAYKVQTVSCPSEVLQIDPVSEATFSFLPSAPIEFDVADVKLSSRNSVAGAPDAVVEARGSTVSLRVPEAAAANGDLFRFTLETVLRQGESSATIVCTLELSTRRTLENAELPVAANPVAPRGPVDDVPAPTATATPKPAAPAPTATATKSPTRVPGPPSPRPPQGIRTPTPRSGPTGR